MTSLTLWCIPPPPPPARGGPQGHSLITYIFLQESNLPAAGSVKAVDVGVQQSNEVYGLCRLCNMLRCVVRVHTEVVTSQRLRAGEHMMACNAI